MLDAYIIERIRRERERDSRQRNSQLPLHIDDRREPPPRERPRRDDEPGDRGSVQIDFHL